MSANEKQVGGDHYKAHIQHWDFIELNGLSYLVGCATKYVTRWRKKDGLKDLEKAKHYIQKLREFNEAGKISGKGLISYNRLKDAPGIQFPPSLIDFFECNDLTETEKRIIYLLVNWKRNDDLADAEKLVDALLFQASGHPA